MSRGRLIVCVLLPFAAGYYLSYLFRTINALIASDLTAELNLSAADLGLLTSVYFLVFAAVQLPLGALLDRYGPRTIQSALLLLASGGALVFALADSLLGLVVGRTLLGLGVAMALMAGFKAIVLWFPPDRLALANGWLVMLGALGAVTATAPAEFVVLAIGWRGLFAVLAGLSALAALLVLLAVPEPSGSRPPSRAAQPSLRAVYQDRRFWRIAPLSALGIGTSWSLQGLWAAPWLRDVDGLDRAAVVQHLSVMADFGLRQRAASGNGRGPASSSRPQDRARVGMHLRRIHVSPGGTGARMANPIVSALVGDRSCRSRDRAQLRSPVRVFPERNVRARQRGTQPPARRRRVRPAIGHRPHYRAVARGRAAAIPLKRTNWPWALALACNWSRSLGSLCRHNAVPVPTMARAARSISERSLRATRDSDDTLHNGRPGVDTACRACQQASRRLAIRRGRIGGALRRPGGSSFHDD